MNFEKNASTAAIRAFRKELISEKNLENIAKYTNKIMKIKTLGKGGFQQAELIAHPKYGLSAMKIPHEIKTLSNGKFSRKLKFNLKGDELKKRNDIFDSLQYLKKISKGKKDVQIAHVLGKKGPLHFQEYVRKNISDKNLDKAFLTDASESLYEKGTREANKSVTFNKTTNKILKRFKKTYPGTYDLKRANVVGGKLVDFEPGKKFNKHK